MDDIRPAPGEDWSATPFRWDDGTVKAMLGGRDQGRQLVDQGPYGLFEQTVERVLGPRIRDCATDDAAFALRAALEMRWSGPHGALVAYSARAAGDLCVAVRRQGHYVQYAWPDPQPVADWITVAMALEGWTWEADD
jgi:hypothetical protein